MATTIQVGLETRDRLKSIGRKGETYDSVIQRLLQSAQYVGFMEEQYSILKNEKNWRNLREVS
jgi:hypothetical protein